MAHARRKFNDALKIDPKDKDAAWVIAMMAKLYAVEKEAREAGASPEERKELRQKRSSPIAEELKARIEKLSRQSLPSSKLGEACTYALNQWVRSWSILSMGALRLIRTFARTACDR